MSEQNEFERIVGENGEVYTDRQRLYDALGQAYQTGGAPWNPAVPGCPGCVERDMSRHPDFVYWIAGADEEAFDEDDNIREPLRVRHAGVGAPVLSLFLRDNALLMLWDGNLSEGFSIVSANTWDGAWFREKGQA